MNLPMAERQGSTGAFAKRVSEYDSVRDFFASTSVVLIVDIGFMLVFLVLIAVLAGWLVAVPVVGIALTLLAGFALQRAMGRAAIDAQADSSLQHSVLIESIAGIETLKAARAEGQMLGRWRRYAAMSAATQERLRRLTSVAVNLASVAQQVMSVALLIGGFYLFNSGDITMGAIIAIVACYKGMTASCGAEGVGRAVNQGVVITFLAIFAFNYVFTQTLLATHPEISVIK